MRTTNFEIEAERMRLAEYMGAFVKAVMPNTAIPQEIAHSSISVVATMRLTWRIWLLNCKITNAGTAIALLMANVGSITQRKAI